MGGAHSRRKGHQFERDVAIALREIFPLARRQLENHVDDCNGVDIQGTPGYKFQCKKLKSYASVNTIREIQCDRALDVPVLVTAGDKQEAMAVLPFKELLKLLLALKRASNGELDCGDMPASFPELDL